MTDLVETSEGLLPREDLSFNEMQSEGDNDLSVAREWVYQGRVVRRDVWVTMKRGVSAAVEGKLNG